MEFIDLGAQMARIKPQLDARIQKVLSDRNFIMGPEVAELEAALSAFCGSPRPALTCSNGTDAISLVLMAQGIGPGDAVFVPTFTFAATAETVALQRATPVFVDVLADTFNMDPESLKDAIIVAKAAGLRPRAVITVDLFGLPADYDKIEVIAEEAGLDLICDAAQGFGGVYKGRNVGTIGLATTTSFFPAKPLGCYGDGGAVFTSNTELAAAMTSLRVHGKGSDKYDNVRIGLNARLDTMQAAILLEKLAIFAGEINSRNEVAARYTEALSMSNGIVCPVVPTGLVSSWAQYTVRLDPAKRDAVSASLKAKGVPSVVYYPRPLHEQTAYRQFPGARDIGVSSRLSKEVLSLPMHPYLTAENQNKVCEALLDAVKAA
jgi:dTDP-4-amino-4,6-dideoxygalactose transaminase